MYYSLISSMSKGGSSQLLLDVYPNAIGAYSLRKLRSAYTGYAVRVRRSSDNTSQDIGFVNNVLDTTSLLSFVGANDGFVSIWYDQSGNSYDFVQSTGDFQPQIVSTGSVITKNSKPTIKFDGLSDYMEIASSTSTFSFLHKTGQSAINFVGYNSLLNESVLIANNYGSSAYSGYTLYLNALNKPNNFITRAVSGQPTVYNIHTSASTTNSLFLLNDLTDNGNATASLRSKLYLNNGTPISANTSTNTPSTTNTTFNLFLGVSGGSPRYAYLNGGVSEVIIYNSSQTSNITGINTNINSFYSFY